MNQSSLPKGVKTPEERKNLAARVCEMIDGGIIQKGQLPDRWERLEQLYRLQPISTGTEISGVVRGIPIMKPRVKQIVSNVCNPLFSVEPYFAARGYGGQAEYAQTCQKNVHFFAQRMQFDRRTKKACNIAAKADPAIVRIHFETGDGPHGSKESDTRITDYGKYVGPTMTVIHPNDFVLFPLYAGDIEEATFVGHRFAKRAQDIRELQKRGVYLDVTTDFGSDDPQEWESGNDRDWSMTETSTGIPDEKDFPIEMWEGILKWDLDEDGFEERYLVQVAKSQQVLLLIEPYGAEVQTAEVGEEIGEDGERSLFHEDGTEFRPYSRPWYFPLSMVEDDGEFYRSNPIAQDLQEIQLTSNELWSQFVDGSMMAATPAGFTNSPMLQSQMVKYEPGTVYNVDDPGGIMWVDCKFNGGNHPYMLEVLEKKADSVVSLSYMGAGQESQSDTTATEASGILQGQRTGMDDVRSTVCTFLSPMYDFIRELLFVHWDHVLEVYGDELPSQDIECMSYGYTWEPTVKGGMNTPQEVSLKLQNFQQFLMSVGVPMSPGVVTELINVFMGALDLPTDMERLKQEITSAYQQQLMMQETQQGDQSALEQGIQDGLTESAGSGGNAGVPGMGLPQALANGKAPAGAGVPGFMQGR